MNQYKKALEEIKEVVLISENHPSTAEVNIGLALVHAKALSKISQIVNQDFEEKCCEPFQSCEKCKTEWLPISELKESLKMYWLLDKNNNVAEGYLKSDCVTISVMANIKGTFGTPVMFAEIKPPEVPK